MAFIWVSSDVVDVGIWSSADMALLTLLLVTSTVPAHDMPLRGILLGDVIDQYSGFNSFVIMRDDPAIAATLVPSRADYVSRDAAVRNLRVYMPRSYSSYATNYNFTLISDCDAGIIRPLWVEWMVDSVREGGLGFLWLGSLESQDLAFTSWEGSILAEIAPIYPHPRRDIWGLFTLVVLRPDDPLMGSMPWETSPGILHFNTQIPRQGGIVLAVTEPQRHPLMTEWSVGRGRVLCFSGKFPRGMENWAREWRFFPQAMIYMAYDVGGRSLPPDPVLFERLIRYFQNIRVRNELVLSISEFSERFGAQVGRIHSEMTRISQDGREAETMYLRSEYSSAMGLLESILERQLELVEESMELKDRALSWIFFTEWISVFAAMMLSFSSIWTLMIRRRLYVRPGITRARGKKLRPRPTDGAKKAGR